MLSADGSIQPGFRESVHPYQILGATMTPRGSCAATNLGPPPQPASTPGPVRPQKVTEGGGYMMNIVVPVVVIVLCILLAVLVACILVRRRRQADKVPFLTILHYIYFRTAFTDRKPLN